ncbi:MAG: hypothetical protein ACOY0T_22025 [Myxococcota bacterium]
MRNLKFVLSAGVAAWVSLGCLAGCGSDAPNNTNTGGMGAATEPLLPWAVGNTWTYRVTEAGVVSEKVTTVMEQTKVGGVGASKDLTAYYVVTKKGASGNDKTESYQAPDPAQPDRVLRYRELSYGAMTGMLELEEYWEPARIHADGSRISEGDWVDEYTEYKLPVGMQPTPGALTHDLWIVVSADEAVETPKGRFDHAVHLQKTGGSVKEYWYVRGVGKVRETGGQTEELLDYKLNAPINKLK